MTVGLSQFFRADTTGQTLGSGENVVGEITSTIIRFYKRNSNLTLTPMNTGSIPAGVSFIIGNGSYFTS